VHNKGALALNFPWEYQTDRRGQIV